MPERICIVGCGAIGGLYAAHLAQLPELEVWALDVSAAHVGVINREGLRLTGVGSLTATLHACTDPGEVPSCRLGIVATKSTFTEAACVATEPVFADAAVCSVQNGIGNEELLARHIPRVLRGVTLAAASVATPGVIEVHGLGPTWIGPFEPQPARSGEVQHLAQLLTRAGLPTVACADARGPQWTKLLFNAGINPLCALTGLTHGELCDHPPTRAVAAGIVAEGRSVARSLGITLDQDPDELIDTAGAANHRHRPSMLQDVVARRPTEIDALNGGIVRAGETAGVPTPLNSTVRGLILGLERSWRQ
jgi:2-dehydropantoate 2-reductase